MVLLRQDMRGDRLPTVLPMMRRRDAIATFLAMLSLWAIVGTIEKCDAERAAKAAHLAQEPGDDPWGWEPQ